MYLSFLRVESSAIGWQIVRHQSFQYAFKNSYAKIFFCALLIFICSCVTSAADAAEHHKKSQEYSTQKSKKKSSENNAEKAQEKITRKKLAASHSKERSHALRKNNTARSSQFSSGIDDSVMLPKRESAESANSAALLHSPSTTPLAADPDALLMQVYQDLANNQLRQAQTKVDSLIKAYPNFRLAYLIRGDLFLMHTQPVSILGAGANAPHDKLNDLRQEAIVRLRAFQERPRADLVPRALLQLPKDQQYALIVDVKKSRLYIYQNDNGRPKLFADYYMTQGKYGSDKAQEGDQKTPLGVYHITSYLTKSQLPDFYGDGALPINYPNDWDRLNGRSGSGIWLHGTPSDSYSRPPHASDGCVVLANPDLKKLTASVQIGKTPVIIADNVEFITLAQWQSEREGMQKMIESWRQDWESSNAAQILKNYSARFKPQNEKTIVDWIQKRQSNLIDNARIKIKDLAVIRYPGNKEMFMASFVQSITSKKSAVTTSKRQYWLRENNQWKIILEN